MQGLKSQGVSLQYSLLFIIALKFSMGISETYAVYSHHRRKDFAIPTYWSTKNTDLSSVEKIFCLYQVL
jgi:hypothetical protein